jgi:hypothetical protein
MAMIDSRTKPRPGLLEVLSLVEDEHPEPVEHRRGVVA